MILRPRGLNTQANSRIECKNEIRLRSIIRVTAHQSNEIV